MSAWAAGSATRSHSSPAPRSGTAPSGSDSTGPPTKRAGWLLTRLPSSGWEAATWRAVPAKTADFAATHARLSGSADSRFVRVLVAKRWGPTGLIDLHGLMYTPGHAAVPIELGTRDELLAALDDGFGLDLSDVSPGAIDRLWRHAAEGHERWVAAGRP